MKKFFGLIVAAVLVAGLAMPAFATDSRVTALGGTGNYLEDDYNIFNWPATLPSYTNMVWISVNHYRYYSFGEFGLDHDYFTMIGATYGFGEDNKYGTLGMFFYNWAPPLNMIGGYDDVFTDYLNSKFDIIYAYPMESLTIGIHFTRADEYDYVKEEHTDTTEVSQAYTTIGAGVRFDLGDNAYGDVAFDISFGSYSDDSNDYYGTVEPDANMSYAFRARVFYAYNDEITLVPYLGYSYYDFRLKASMHDSAFAANNWGDKGMMFNFGVGANVKVNEDNLLVFAIEPFDYYKYEPSQAPDTIEASYTYTVMPRFFLAIESDVKDWLTFRAGGIKALGKSKEESNEEGEYEETSTEAPFMLFMGLGFHVGDFDIDCVISNELPYHLGYWLTGYPWDSYHGPYTNGISYSNEPIYMVTGTYHF